MVRVNKAVGRTDIPWTHRNVVMFEQIQNYPRWRSLNSFFTSLQKKESGEVCSMCSGGIDKNKQGDAEELVQCSECKKNSEYHTNKPALWGHFFERLLLFHAIYQSKKKICWLRVPVWKISLSVSVRSVHGILSTGGLASRERQVLLYFLVVYLEATCHFQPFIHVI